MKKLVMALVVAASAMTMVGCAVQPVQVHGVVVDKKFIPQHDQIKDTTTAYAGRVYPGSYRMRVPNQFILVIKTPRGVVESLVSENEFRMTPVGKRLMVETTEVVWASDVKK